MAPYLTQWDKNAATLYKAFETRSPGRLLCLCVGYHQA